MSNKENCTAIGKVPEEGILRPLGAYDFCTYLKNKGILDDPLKYTARIRELLDRMAATGILVEMGYGENAMMPKMYYCMKELSNSQKWGNFWVAPALGDDFLYHLASSAVVQITGKNPSGDPCAGTGIVFDQHHILTCAHVVKDVDVDKVQIFQGFEHHIEQCFVHPQADVAVVRVRRFLELAVGLSFLSPRIAQPVFTLGYPKIPFVREAALTMQRGEVTNELVTTFDGHKVFLYSAIARPGNSGGPIISSEGYVIGISMQDLFQQDERNPFSPHYAGIPTHQIAQCLDELDIGVQIPVEDFN